MELVNMLSNLFSIKILARLSKLNLSYLLTKIKLLKEEALDVYYAIFTSENKKQMTKLLIFTGGLWRIEETFKVTKSELAARPVYVSREDHIQAHFLTCYLALVLSRILQHKLDKKYSVTKILESLSKCNCQNLEENIYRFNFFDTVLKRYWKCYRY